MKIFKDLMKPSVRSYFYKVTVALIALLGTLGVFSQEILPFVMALVAAIFAVGLADGNINQEEEDQEEEPFKLYFKE